MEAISSCREKTVEGAPVSVVAVADKLVAWRSSHATFKASRISLHAAEKAHLATVNGPFHERLHGRLCGIHLLSLVRLAGSVQWRWTVTIVKEMRLEDGLGLLLKVEDHELADSQWDICSCETEGHVATRGAASEDSLGLAIFAVADGVAKCGVVVSVATDLRVSDANLKGLVAF